MTFGFYSPSVSINPKSKFLAKVDVKPQQVEVDPFFDKEIDLSEHQGHIQINPVPHPFSISGEYVVWVNGKRVNLNRQEVKNLAESLNLPLTKPQDTAEIHSGMGWQTPFAIK
jgi:hypothetical protein